MWRKYREGKISYAGEPIDAELEVITFRDYIRPVLGICKRFVGEEPSDIVTNQYNQLLKKDLGQTMDVIEIPRKTEGGEVISATKIRSCLENGNWEEIRRMAPDSTVVYLKKNLNRIMAKKDVFLNKAVKFIENHSKVMICGLGANAENLFLQLENGMKKEDLDKLEFYDRKAAQENYCYRGKKVHSFDEVVGLYSEYFMLITTNRFHQEIFHLLVQNGIDPRHIMIVYAWV